MLPVNGSERTPNPTRSLFRECAMIPFMPQLAIARTIMSSWERSRYIPWDRIPKDGSDLEHQREAIFRDLQREAVEEDQLRPVDIEASSNGTAKTASTMVPYSHMELLRQAAFGGCIGSITGAVFGFMDGMKTARESNVMTKASNMAKGKYLLQGTTRSATLFGVFFSGFHVAKYGLRVTIDPGDAAEIGLAGAASMAALLYQPAYRASMPYAAMLIFMDAFNVVMRKTQ
jgi:hypothetical protein